MSAPPLAEADDVVAWWPELFAFAYRMTGSAADGEDIVQDVIAHWLAGDYRHVAEPRKYLARAVQNRCRTLLQRRPPQRGTRLPEPLVYPRPGIDGRFDLSFGLWLVLAGLTPLERAVFLLREGFDFSYEELAQELVVRPDHCRQLYHRARQRLGERQRRFIPSAAEQQRLLLALGQALDTGDLPALMRLLSEDVRAYADGGNKRPAAQQPLRGRGACARYLLGLRQKVGGDLLPEVAWVNGALAVLLYQPASRQLDSVLALDYEADAIGALYLVLDPDKLACAGARESY